MIHIKQDGFSLIFKTVERTSVRISGATYTSHGHGCGFLASVFADRLRC